MQVTMKKDVFGLAKGYTYKAEVNDSNSVVVTNGTFKGVVLNEDVEVVE